LILFTETGYQYFACLRRAFFTKRICQSNQIVFKGLDMLKRNIETEFFSQKRREAWPEIAASHA